MPQEVVYPSSAATDSNKRKYDDSPSPVARRATGFSSAPDSAAPLSSYNSVPPPMNEIELAKQKAQEIAARLLNNADPLKRARVDNGGADGGGGCESSDYGYQKHLGLGLTGPPQVASSGYPGPAKKIDIPNSRVGVIIGKGGETIKYLQLQSGAKIQVTRDTDADPNAPTRGVELTGTPDQIAKAEQLINDVLSEAEAGGSGIVSRRLTGQPSGSEQFVMKVPNNKVGLVIGKGGETIKNMQAQTGARIQVIPLHLPPGDTSKERTVQIDGTSEQIEAAKQMVEEVISENRARNTSMSGGYPQQGHQQRPQANWGQPMQQPSYSYAQGGGYPPQYNMYQGPYSGYPPQAATGGYGWDQSSAPQNPQASQGGSYDYYNQQQQQSTDGSGYGYTQSTGYGQDGYGGYHGYGQQTGYDQQQQGYNSNNNSSTYGNLTDATNQQPSYAQGGYGQGAAGSQAGGYPTQSPNGQGYYSSSQRPGGYGAPPGGVYGGGYGQPAAATYASDGGNATATATAAAAPSGGAYESQAKASPPT